MTKRAILYARVSSDDRGRDGRNLSGQLDMCREYAERQGWQVVAELAEDDRGASGASFELPELGRILEMAESGDFDIMVVRELDRLSRNLAKQLVVEEELRRNNVGVEYVLEDYTDTPEGRLNKHIRATIAEYEREKITERMSRGRRNKVKAGNVLTYRNPPYGYREVEQAGKQTLAIYEPEARVVRMVFSLYTYGDEQRGPIGPRTIAHTLTSLGIPTCAQSRGTYRRRPNAPWSESVIHRMLRNETYSGSWHFGKKRRNGAGKWETNGDDHLLTVAVPAIVSDELWEAVQKRLNEKRACGQSKPKHEYLLARQAICGHCGIKAHGKPTWSKGRVYLYYRCAAAVKKGDYVRACDAPSFRADKVDAEVWRWIESFLMDPEALERGLREHQQDKEREHAPVRDRLAVVDDLLSDNRAQLNRVLDLYLSGEFPKEILIDRKTRQEEAIIALEQERAGLVTRLETQLLSTDQIHTIQEFAAKVRVNLEAMGHDFGAKRRIIEALDVSATLAVENGKRVVYARCILGEQVCGLRNIPLVV